MNNTKWTKEEVQAVVEYVKVYEFSYANIHKIKLNRSEESIKYKLRVIKNLVLNNSAPKGYEMFTESHLNEIREIIDANLK
ncbi:hypothetical protein [Endozoicomonas sp. SCSIO W0465]|uniref:hypothetical protein n=1 Tax=Endozoicomonas sp. SCSIO W0465 TaxID=2918516 RepID=UPI0020754DF8|nr:hypothetical protein [Endozoicomonas sp. SCSIO W0465]USE39522.1 hypothetical protein MJO57_15970 [Endozoicomonas sp. SCSIO W0465]